MATADRLGPSPRPQPLALLRGAALESQQGTRGATTAGRDRAEASTSGESSRERASEALNVSPRDSAPTADDPGAALARVRESNCGLVQANRALRRRLGAAERQLKQLLAAVEALLHDMRRHGRLGEDAVDAWYAVEALHRREGGEAPPEPGDVQTH